MNIIKKVVVFVMGLVVIGVVATTIGVVTQPKIVEKNVTFELLNENTVPSGTYNSLIVLGTVDNEKITLEINGNIVNFTSINYNGINNYIVITSDEGDALIIYNGDTYVNDGFPIIVGDTITFTFDVEVQTPAIIKTLLFLAPLILSAGLIGYLTFKKGDE